MASGVRTKARVQEAFQVITNYNINSNISDWNAGTC